MNKCLAFFLARSGNCNYFYDELNNINLYTNCKGPTKYIIEDVLKATTITIENSFFTANSIVPSCVYRHELAHTRQYEIFGPTYLPLYAFAHLSAVIDSKIHNYTNPHATNFFEMWANYIAGLPQEDKYLKY